MHLKFLPLLSLLSLPASGVVIYQTSNIRVGNILADPPYVRSFLMDVNNDGITDWALGTRSSESFSGLGLSLPVGGTPASTLFVHHEPEGGAAGGFQYELKPLASGTAIGSIIGSPEHILLDIFTSRSAALATSVVNTGSENGPFNRKTAYLGFRFEAASGSHFGYALLQDVTSSSAIIAAYAWESESNTAILAGAIPEPSATLLLSLASFLIIGTRKRK